MTQFQSTHPARGATASSSANISVHKISIHAPREGCDLLLVLSKVLLVNFNPRTPRGVRQQHFCSEPGCGEFQSTHPARGATRWLNFIFLTLAISIHAPREGCDPAGGRGMSGSGISIHAPREGCDCGLGVIFAEGTNFNPRTPRGVRRPRAIRLCRPLIYFNPRTPRGVRQQTLPKSREFAWLNLLICTRGRRLSIQKQTRLCSIKLSFMLFGCEPAGEGVSSWTSHATKSKVRLEGRSAYSQSARSSAHSDFPGNKSGDCPVRGP